MEMLFLTVLILNIATEYKVTGNLISLATTGTNSSRLLHRLFLDYESAISPHADMDIPTVVQVGVYISGFSSVSEITMDYKVTLMLRQSWEDPRLDYSNLSARPSLSLPGASATNLWLPDLIFNNEKQGNLHQVTRDNRMLRIYRNGTILYSQRLSLSVACSMKLQKYPFDEQICLLEMESFAYTVETLQFVWFKSSPLEVTDNLELPHFHLLNYNTTESGRQYFTGEYPCLIVTFHLKRERGYHFIQSYVPSMMIVLISWISFWVNADATAARVSLGVTTVLTMVTMNMAVRSSLPPVSYIKSIDIWTSTCLMFVFSALIEFAFVNSCVRRLSKKDNRRAIATSNIAIAEDTDTGNKTDVSKGCLSLKPKFVNESKKRLNIDKYARIVFPLGFLIFNIIYWILALSL